MSTCVSRHGEYSNHIPDGDFNCTRCWQLDEDGLRAERDRLAAENAELRKVAEAAERLGHAWRDQYADAIGSIRRELEAAVREWRAEP